MTPATLILLLALICFLIAAVGVVAARVNLLALGLFLWLLSVLVSGARGGTATTPPVTVPTSEQDWLTFIQGVSTARALNISFAGTYSSQLTSRYGLMGEAGYPINDFLSVNVRGYMMDNSFFEAAGGVTAKADIQLFKLNFTPYEGLYAIKGIGNGDPNQPDKTGVLSATGLKVMLWRSQDRHINVSALGEIDYISFLPGVKTAVFGGQLRYDF
jgi:hypothetical protein